MIQILEDLTKGQMELLLDAIDTRINFLKDEIPTMPDMEGIVCDCAEVVELNKLYTFIEFYKEKKNEEK